MSCWDLVNCFRNEIPIGVESLWIGVVFLRVVEGVGCHRYNHILRNVDSVVSHFLIALAFQSSNTQTKKAMKLIRPNRN